MEAENQEYEEEIDLIAMLSKNTIVDDNDSDKYDGEENEQREENEEREKRSRWRIRRTKNYELSLFYDASREHHRKKRFACYLKAGA